MQAARQAFAQQLGLARALTNLRDLLEPTCALQRLPYATHGVGEGNNSADGVPRFYKSVHVKEALDQVRRRRCLPPAAAARC